MIQLPVRNLSLVLATVLAATLLGCKPSDTGGPSASPPAATHDHADHDHGDGDHDHAAPADLAGAVTALQQQYQAIRDAFQANDPDQAHQPLHEVGHTLEALTELGAKSHLAEPQKAAVKSAVTTMFEAYGEIDGAMHEGQPADYEAVASKLDQAMADIQQALQSLSQQPQDAETQSADPVN